MSDNGIFNDNIQLSFGQMSELQISYIDKLTYCDVVFINGTDIRGKKMSCVLDGIKSSKQHEGLQLNDTKIIALTDDISVNITIHRDKFLL